MGSRSKRHGLTGVKFRQPKSNVAARNRKGKLNERKKPLLASILAAIKSVSESS
ncbi:MAG: hypothetical protein WC304_01250 [Candidatus Gracilibacteria bacterium]|jgi:hypothetical protein